MYERTFQGYTDIILIGMLLVVNVIVYWQLVGPQLRSIKKMRLYTGYKIWIKKARIKLWLPGIIQSAAILAVLFFALSFGNQLHNS
jgi:hypothetical protein